MAKMTECCCKVEEPANQMATDGYSVSTDRRPVVATFCIDQDGNPKGGTTEGEGFWIEWQNGVQQRQGAFLEEVIEACIQRFQFFQSSKFACDENAAAITHLKAAVAAMQARLANRAARGVEGTYKL